MIEKKMRKYWEMLNDIWELFKEFARSDNSDESNKRYFERVAELDIKYNRSKFFRGIVLVVQEELDRIASNKLGG